MNNVVQLADYGRYFEKDTLKALPTYEAEWFKDGSRFEDDKWTVACVAGKTRDIFFDRPISLGKRLTDFPGLTQAVKVSAYLCRTVHGKEFSAVTSGAQQSKNVDAMYGFIRWLALNNIYNLSSVNKAVFKAWLDSSPLPIAQRLNLIPRLQTLLGGRTTEDLQGTYGIRHSTGMLEFSFEKLADELGVTGTLLAGSESCLEYLDALRVKHCFYIKKRQREALGGREKLRTRDTIRKELTPISGFMTQTIIFSELFPENQRFTHNFLSALNTTPTQFAKKVGQRGGSTKNIPQPMFFELMDAAIRWVTDYAEPLIEIGEQTRTQLDGQPTSDRGGTDESKVNYHRKLVSRWLATQGQDLQGLPASPFPLSGITTSIRSQEKSLSKGDLIAARDMREKGLSLTETAKVFGVNRSTLHRLLEQGYQPEGTPLREALYDFLPTACLLVIYCFTARREHEIESLNAGCCFMTERGPVIKMYSGKYLQGYEVFPTTQLVCKAVGILEQLSESVRTDADQRILQFPTFGEADKVQFWSGGKMTDFAKHLNLPSDNGEGWRFSEHQFRRFFAMMYFYRWDGGDLASLSWHLRHTDFETTAAYLTDADGTRAFLEVRDERLLSFAIGATNSNSKFSGGMSQEFKSLVESAKATEPRRLEKILAKKIDEVGYVMDFVPDGVCMGRTPSYESRAKCAINGVIQFSAACSEVCSGCPNLLAYREQVTQDEFYSALNPSESPMLAAALGGSNES